MNEDDRKKFDEIERRADGRTRTGIGYVDPYSDTPEADREWLIAALRAAEARGARLREALDKIISLGRGRGAFDARYAAIAENAIKDTQP